MTHLDQHDDELTTSAQLTQALQQRDKARTELKWLRAYLRALVDNGTESAQWVVARDGGRHCERCEQEVRRGEAYQLQDGTGGLLLHIHCPDQAAS